MVGHHQAGSEVVVRVDDPVAPGIATSQARKVRGDGSGIGEGTGSFGSEAQVVDSARATPQPGAQGGQGFGAVGGNQAHGQGTVPTEVDPLLAAEHAAILDLASKQHGEQCHPGLEFGNGVDDPLE